MTACKRNLAGHIHNCIELEQRVNKKDEKMMAGTSICWLCSKRGGGVAHRTHGAHMTGRNWAGGGLLQMAIFLVKQTIEHPHPVHVLLVITLWCGGVGAYTMLVAASMEC